MSQKSRILTVAVAGLLACAALSCSRKPTRPAQPQTLFDSSATQPAAAADPTLVADYSTGDGLGYNLSLSLREDTSFECTWTGCLGVYGTASGWWFRDNDRVRFVTREATEMLVGYLNWADVVTGGAHPALVLSQDRDFYDQHGLSRYSALQRSARVAPAATQPAT